MITKLKSLNKNEETSYFAVQRFYEIIREIFSDHEELSSVTDTQEEFVAIPMSGHILQTMLKIRKTFPEHKTFLDVGCGKGNILYLAKYAGFKPKGIEFREEYKDFHKYIDVFYGKAEEYGDYYNADVIYLYRPLKGDKRMTALMNIIVSKCKPGAIIFPCGCGIVKGRENFQLITGEDSLYIKK